MDKLFSFDSLKTLSQWLIFTAAVGISLSSPAGTRAFIRELNQHLSNVGKSSVGGNTHQQLSQALYRMKKRKLIRIEHSNNKTVVTLTERGKRRKLEYDLEFLTIPKQTPWDGMWRIVMFDIPESKRSARQALKNRLQQLGFTYFQKSVWLFPYPCEKEIDFVAEILGVAKYNSLIKVKIENDKPLRNKFKL